ncbi:putative DNA binding domain-containing protein [Moraxella nasibovis]|uniref:RNA-binding domain-containing protein n=1 Tax=Moraxella nasibovis TaxID=2904120 RepID=UPI00240FE9ED|nr:RNA-binding domain-containing protein [Moraxella nasibovis]WFF38314.1 putative DNA binding domain-containing protein [Moraxella nasibovis]
MILANEIFDLYDALNRFGETNTLEAKKASQTIGDSVMQTICAFANTAGGYLLLGVSEPDEKHDEFWVSGVSDSDKLLNQIQTNCRSQFNQSIPIDMGIAKIDQKTVIAVKVDELPNTNKPCSFIAKGKNGKNFTKTGVWLRGINNDYEATFDELKPLLVASAGFSHEQMVLDGVSFDDIDPKHLERYRKLRKQVKPNATELDFDDEELLLALDVAVKKDGNIYPNVAGLLLFGRDMALRRLMPMARVDYIRHAGTVWAEDSQQRFLHTNDLREAIITMIPKLEATIIDDLPKHFYLPPNSLSRADTPILPQAVVREAVVNMLMHRDYATNRPSQINRFSDRIEFTNAGYSLKPVEQIVEGQKGSELRNPIIAQVLYDLTFAETKGSGITIMNRGLKNAGLSPIVFKSVREYNECEIVLRLQKLIDEDDMAWLERFGALTDKEAEVLILVKKMGQITNKDIQINIGLETLKASSILKKFCAKGQLIKHGKGNTMSYTLHPSLIANNPSTGINGLSTEISSTGNEPSLAGNKPSLAGNEESAPQVITDLSILPTELQQKFIEITKPAKDKKRLKPELMQALIIELCLNHYLTSKVLAQLLDRNQQFLRADYLLPMVKNGKLILAYPNQPTHENQAYKSTQKERPQ